jgi:hypothetical protein
MRVRSGLSFIFSYFNVIINPIPVNIFVEGILIVYLFYFIALIYSVQELGFLAREGCNIHASQ